MKRSRVSLRSLVTTALLIGAGWAISPAEATSRCTVDARVATAADGASGARRLLPICPPSRSPLHRSSVARPTIEGPVTGGNGNPFVATTGFDLAEVGYQQAEYFISGTASGFTSAGPFTSDGRWKAARAGSAPYKTRILVYRPIDRKE